MQQPVFAHWKLFIQPQCLKSKEEHSEHLLTNWNRFAEPCPMSSVQCAGKGQSLPFIAFTSENSPSSISSSFKTNVLNLMQLFQRQRTKFYWITVRIHQYEYKIKMCQHCSFTGLQVVGCLKILSLLKPILWKKLRFWGNFVKKQVLRLKRAVIAAKCSEC